jgi:FAD/FMN-containing dehydrogenase
VQGGGCTTVGVAGLMLSGGFGSFSKRYGLAAAGLLEAEVVTADGVVRIANACTHPELFWALKGGGGGSFGVVTRLTLRTHALPAAFGGVFGAIKATSDTAFRALTAQTLRFYHEHLFTPQWGEQLRWGPDNTLRLGMVCCDLDQQQAVEVWRPFLDWVTSAPQDFAFAQPVQIVTLPARQMWNARFLTQHAPGLVVADARPDAPAGHFWWHGDADEVGRFWHGYRSAWLPAALLAPERQRALADALFAGSRHWPIALHCNKRVAQFIAVCSSGQCTRELWSYHLGTRHISNSSSVRQRSVNPSSIAGEYFLYLTSKRLACGLIHCRNAWFASTKL